MSEWQKLSLTERVFLRIVGDPTGILVGGMLYTAHAVVGLMFLKLPPNPACVLKFTVKNLLS